jgi:hypothetical protein
MGNVCLVRTLSRSLRPFTWLVGHIPGCAHRDLKNAEVVTITKSIKRSLQPGDFIMSFMEGRPTNMFLSGAPYTHLGVVVHGDNIVEAVSAGVQVLSLQDFVHDKHRLLVLRAPGLTSTDRETMVRCAMNLVGRPYDFSFEVDTTALYCTEIALHCLRSVRPNFPEELNIKPTIGNPFYSVTYRGNSFLQAAKENNLTVILEWRIEDPKSSDLSVVNTARLYADVDDPADSGVHGSDYHQTAALSRPYCKNRVRIIHESLKVMPAGVIFPSLSAHRLRYKRQHMPLGELVKMPLNCGSAAVWRDSSTLESYITKPWYKNLFHRPWCNTKMVSWDALHGVPESLGSIEIQVPTKMLQQGRIPINSVLMSYYNYRDTVITGVIDHWLADVLPGLWFCC